MAVKKRQEIPDEMLMSGIAPPSPEEIKIVVGEREYPLPRLKLKEYKKLLKKIAEQDENQSEEAALEFMREFYYELLSIENPEITREDLDEMPLYQFGAEFLVKLKLALFHIPLDS